MANLLIDKENSDEEKLFYFQSGLQSQVIIRSDLAVFHSLMEIVRISEVHQTKTLFESDLTHPVRYRFWMLIYLNGTSSSGKTSIAVELQKLISRPVFYFSIDTLLYSLGTEDLEAIMGKRPYRHPMKWESVFAGYFSSVAALIRTGNEVIADCPVYHSNMASAFNEYFAGLPQKVIVKVSCPLEILEQRERARGDRALGIAKKQFDGIHDWLPYDVEVATDQFVAKDSALKILDCLK